MWEESLYSKQNLKILTSRVGILIDLSDMQTSFPDDSCYWIRVILQVLFFQILWIFFELLTYRNIFMEFHMLIIIMILILGGGCAIWNKTPYFLFSMKKKRRSSEKLKEQAMSTLRNMICWIMRSVSGEWKRMVLWIVWTIFQWMWAWVDCILSRARLYSII